MTLKRQLLSGLKWTAAGKFSGQIITWGITILVMRLLSPSDYGLLAIASVFIAFLLLFSEIGLAPALIQTAEISEVKLRQAFGIVLAINGTLLLLLNLLAPVIADFFGDERLVAILRVLSVQFPIIAFTVIPEVLLQRQLDFRTRSLIDFSVAIASSLITLMLALAHYGVWSLVIGNLVGSAWKAIAINWVYPFRIRPSFSWHGMRGLLSFGGNVAASRILWFLFTYADTVIVGRMLGKDVLGVYSVAMHLASLPVQRVSAILNQVAFPTLSRFQQDKAALHSQILRLISILSFFAFPVLWGISSSADEIVLVFLGTRWGEAILPLQLLALMMPFRMVAAFLPSVTDALGHPEIALHNVVLGCLVMPLAFYVASRWGIAGVALAWVTAYPVVLFINVRRLLAAVDIGIRQLALVMAPSVSAAAGMYATVWGVRWLLYPLDNYHYSLPVMILVGVVAYANLTLILNRKGCDEMVRLLIKERSPDR